MLVCNGYLKFSELDSWENGCSGECETIFVKYQIESKNKEEAIQQVKDITGETCDDAIELNSCDEPGRVDVQVQEDEHGNRLTQDQWEEFKQGRIKAYLVTYSFLFKQLETFTF